ncbi:unnamed protein product [Cuscuta campestris]|uniref:Uncharacterized protein n=1 Tax=Cuscuta campestris TaxID=132261 RepID=A0A484MLV6_9ASTE|nr:unnamed protein product [Cuscuta campestris]
MLQLPMVLDPAYLDELGHWQDIDELLYDPKWRILLFLHAPASLEAAIEFLCSLRFLNDGEEAKSAAEVTSITKVTFTLMGRLLNLTVADLGWLIGLYTLDEMRSLAFADLPDQLDPEFDVKKFWKAHGHGRFHSGASLARNWARPLWRILHHALAHSYFGCSQEPDVVFESDMLFFWRYLAQIAYNKEDNEARPRRQHTIPMTLRELSQAMFAFQDSVDSRLRSMETLLLTQQWQVEEILDYIREQGAKKTEHEAGPKQGKRHGQNKKGLEFRGEGVGKKGEALKAQVEYLAKEVAKLTKIKLNALQGSDHEDDASTSSTNKAKTNDGSDFKVDVPTFEGKNDMDKFLEWLETVERVFDFKEVSDEKKVKIVALKFRKDASTGWSNTCTKWRRNYKEPVATWAKTKSLLKKKFFPAEYVRENFAKLQTLKQGSKLLEEYTRGFEELLLRCDLQEDDEQTFVRYLFGLNGKPLYPRLEKANRN